MSQFHGCQYVLFLNATLNSLSSESTPHLVTGVMVISERRRPIDMETCLHFGSNYRYMQVQVNHSCTPALFTDRKEETRSLDLSLITKHVL